MRWVRVLGITAALAAGVVTDAYGQGCNEAYQRYLTMPVQEQQAFLRTNPLLSCPDPRNPQLLHLNNGFIRRVYEQQLALGEKDPFTDAVLAPDSSVVFTPNSIYIVQGGTKLPWEWNSGRNHPAMITLSSKNIAGNRQLDSAVTNIEVCRKASIGEALASLDDLLGRELQPAELSQLHEEIGSAALYAPHCGVGQD